MRAIAFFPAALLCAAVVALAFTLPLPAHADSIAQQGADWVRLTPKMCTDEAVKAVIVQKGGDPEAFRAATAHVQGQDYSACWIPVGGGAALVYQDADVGMVPLSALKPVPEA